MNLAMSARLCPTGCSSVLLAAEGPDISRCSQFLSQKAGNRTFCPVFRYLSAYTKQLGIFSYGRRDAFIKSWDDRICSRKNCDHIKVNATSEFPDPTSDAMNYKLNHGYHSSEALGSAKIEKAEIALTDAETARTILEANNEAVVMSSRMLIRSPSETFTLLPIHYQYVTDEYGDIYFQVKNDEDILRSLSTSNSPVHCLIGLESLEAFKREESSVSISDRFFNSEKQDDTDMDDGDFYDEFWNQLVSSVDELDDSDLEEPLGGWTDVDTMRFIDPMEFSTILAEVASTDYSKVMDKPSKGLFFVGFIRPAFSEQNYVDKSPYMDKFSDKETLDCSQTQDDELEYSEVEIESESDSEMHIPFSDGTGWVYESETEEEMELGTSLYKLEILKIYLASFDGNQSVVSLQDFQKAEPDILAHSGENIIARINAFGEKAKTALMALCKRVKGSQVEEATLIGIDRLGIDVRILFETQLQTLRFAFDREATSEFAAERQLRQLLFPQLRYKRRKQEA